MGKRYIMIFVLIFALLCNSSCKKVLRVAVHGNLDLLSFVLEDEVDISPGSDEIIVSEYNPETKKWNYAWRAYHYGNNRLHLGRFNYGVLPDGFQDLDKPNKLRADVLYSVKLDQGYQYAVGEFYIDDRNLKTNIINIHDPDVPDKILEKLRSSKS